VFQQDAAGNGTFNGRRRRSLGAIGASMVCSGVEKSRHWANIKRTSTIEAISLYQVYVREVEDRAHTRLCSCAKPLIRQGITSLAHPRTLQAQRHPQVSLRPRPDGTLWLIAPAICLTGQGQQFPALARRFNAHHSSPDSMSRWSLNRNGTPRCRNLPLHPHSCSAVGPQKWRRIS